MAENWRRPYQFNLDTEGVIKVSAKLPFLDYEYRMTDSETRRDAQDYVDYCLLQSGKNRENTILSILLNDPYLEGSQWSDLLNTMDELQPDTTYIRGQVLQAVDIDYVPEANESNKVLITINNPLTWREEDNYDTLKNYHDNGHVEILHYSDVERKL